MALSGSGCHTNDELFVAPLFDVDEAAVVPPAMGWSPGLDPVPVVGSDVNLSGRGRAGKKSSAGEAMAPTRIEAVRFCVTNGVVR